MQLKLKKAAQQQPGVKKIRDLELENSALKEDMRLFERLIPTVGEEAVVRIESFRGIMILIHAINIGLCWHFNQINKTLLLVVSYN